MELPVAARQGADVVRVYRGRTRTVQRVPVLRLPGSMQHDVKAVDLPSRLAVVAIQHLEVVLLAGVLLYQPPTPVQGPIPAGVLDEHFNERDLLAVQVERPAVDPEVGFAVIDPLELALHGAAAVRREAIRNHVGAERLELMTRGRILVGAPRGGVDPATARHLRRRTLLPEPEEGPLGLGDWARRTVAGPHKHGARHRREEQPQVSLLEHDVASVLWFGESHTTQTQSRCHSGRARISLCDSEL